MSEAKTILNRLRHGANYKERNEVHRDLEILGKEIDSLKAESKKLREGLEFVIKESGTSTSYNKLARQLLSEIDTNNKNLNEFED